MALRGALAPKQSPDREEIAHLHNLPSKSRAAQVSPPKSKIGGSQRHGYYGVDNFVG